MLFGSHDQVTIQARPSHDHGTPSAAKSRSSHDQIVVKSPSRGAICGQVTIKGSVVNRKSYQIKGECFVRMRENDAFSSCYKALSLTIIET